MRRSSSEPGLADELQATAVAAAALAINALEDDFKGTINQKPTSLSHRDSSLIKTMSKKDKATEPEASPPRSSGEGWTTMSQGSPKTQAIPPNLRKRHTFTDQLIDKSDNRSTDIPTSPPPPSPLPPSPPPPPRPSQFTGRPTTPQSPPPRPPQSTGRPTTPQFPGNSNTIRPEASSRKPDKPSTPSSHPQHKATSGSATRQKTKADIWEINEMEKIRERYEKLNETIASWEERKKKKARAKLEKTENEPSRRRLKAMEKFMQEMESINRIVGGARAQAQERQRNEELKVKKKANEYRRTGKYPRTCFCF